MEINKKATIKNNYSRRAIFYENARAGFRAFLKAKFCGKQGKVLLPAYIGWSSKEGSGVFDPIEELGIDYTFYKVTEQLHIDMEDFTKCVRENDIAMAVIIHYFGYVDPAYTDFVKIARNAGVVVFEDEAHSMLSDIVGGICGREGEACVYSLHKILPMNDGGVLILNKDVGKVIQSKISNDITCWDYDLFAIAKKRKDNAAILSQMLQKFSGEIDLLWPEVDSRVIPQTLPVLIRNVSRDKLYEAMNSCGYGVVSLYHTLIEQIKKEEFPVSHELSHKIMNLPVHQDVGSKELCELVDCLESGIKKLKL